MLIRVALPSTIHLALLAMMSLLSRYFAAIFAPAGACLELLLLGWNIHILLLVLPVDIAHLDCQLALGGVWNAEDGLGGGARVDHHVAR